MIHPPVDKTKDGGRSTRCSVCVTDKQQVFTLHYNSNVSKGIVFSGVNAIACDAHIERIIGKRNNKKQCIERSFTWCLFFPHSLFIPMVFPAQCELTISMLCYWAGASLYFFPPCYFLCFCVCGFFPIYFQSLNIIMHLIVPVIELSSLSAYFFTYSLECGCVCVCVSVCACWCMWVCISVCREPGKEPQADGEAAAAAGERPGDFLLPRWPKRHVLN